MRIVVDLPAPLAPRKPKISPCFTRNDRSSTATNSPKRRQSAHVDRGQMAPQNSSCLPDARSSAPRPGASHASARGSHQLGFEQRDLRDQDVGAGRDAGREAIASRRGGPRPLATASSAARTMAWLDSRSSSRCRTSADTTVSNSAMRSRVAVDAAASATSDLARPKSKKFQLTLTPTSHDSLHSSSPGKCAGSDSRSRSRRRTERRSVSSPSDAACCLLLRHPAETPAPCVGSGSSACLTTERAPAAPVPAPWRRAVGELDHRVVRHADQAPQLDGGALAHVRASISCTRSRERCASSVETSFGGIKPTSKRFSRRSPALRRARCDSSTTRSARVPSPPPNRRERSRAADRRGPSRCRRPPPGLGDRGAFERVDRVPTCRSATETTAAS